MIAFGPTEEQQLIRDTVREFAANEMREAARACDEASQVPEDFLHKTWELGLVSSAIPEALGGGGMPRSAVTNALVLEELGFGCASLAAAALAPSSFVLPLLDFGTPEQQSEYLPLFTGAQFHACSLALSEPQFAFDPNHLHTVAEPKGASYVISGSKRFVPLGHLASHFLVVARGPRNGGLQGLDAFIVPRDAHGLRIDPELEKTLGLRATPFSRLELARVEVPAAARLGGEAGIDGVRLIQSCRAASLAVALGISRAMLEFAIPYAKQREAFGQPIAQKQAIAFMLAEMRIELDAMRWLVWKAASALDSGQSAVRETTLARTYVQREAVKIADNGLQVFGGHGYIRDYPVEMWYRNARTVTLLDAVAAL
jgi:alkylation response protein AidB-like acyl-CoA dehydrogenase